MNTLNRRAFLRLATLAAAASAAACSLSAVAEVPRISSDSGPGSAWEKEWGDLIVAAQAEGKLSLLTWGDTWGSAGYPRVVAGFEQVFPGIKVERLSESSASVWLGKVRQGRQAGSYTFDLALVQSDAALKQGKPEGIWAPIRPLLLRPDVLADSAWRDGLHARFLDTSGDLCFSWEYQALHAYAINTDLVSEGEIKTVKDLADPKWAGKLIISDPRIGLGLNSAAAVARSWGNGVVRQLLVEQRPVISAGARDLAEALVRGRYPIALGLRPKALTEFREQGLGNKVRFLDLADADFAATTSLLYFDRAPHPTAARLFANWILTREGQSLLTSSLPTNSARTDVAPFELEGIATVGKTYYEPEREENYQHTADTQQYVTELLRSAR